MRRRLGMGMALVAVGLLAAAPLGAQDQLPGRGRGLGRKVDGQRGRKAIRAEAPPELGALSGLEAVEALKGPLGDAVRQRGDDPTRYADALAADESLWIDATGQLLFVDALEHELPGPDDEPDTTEPTSSVPPPTPGGYLPSGLPLHHSKPGAPWTIFLDFDGATVRGGAGGWSFPVRSTIGLTIDADSLTFNAEEQAVISRTWGRVAEDWMPFDVDITTEQPAPGSHQQQGSGGPGSGLGTMFPPPPPYSGGSASVFPAVRARRAKRLRVDNNVVRPATNERAFLIEGPTAAEVIRARVSDNSIDRGTSPPLGVGGIDEISFFPAGVVAYQGGNDVNGLAIAPASTPA